MKKYLFPLLASLFLFASCSSDDNLPEIQYEDDSLTIFSYLIASKNRLNNDMCFNILTMYDGLASMDKPATLLIYWDGETPIDGKTHLILKYETDGKGNINGKKALSINAEGSKILAEAKVLKEYESQVCTDKEVMKQILRDMKSFAPTDKIGLAIGSHGSSWLNTIDTSGRALGYDETYSNSILLSDMVEALESVGKKFEFILFDTCYMGTTEVCYDFCNVSHYLISSVMEVPAYGFPYDMFMNDLYKGTVEGYKNVCESFINYYEGLDNEYKTSEGKEGQSSWGTVVLIDCKEFSTFTEEIKKEIVSHKEILSDFNVKVLQEYGRAMGYGIAYDLEQFIKELNGKILPDSFKNQLEKTILFKGCLPEASYSKSGHSYKVDIDNYCGLGIYIPVKKYPNWNAYFKTIDWFTASGWNEVDFSWNF